MHASPADETLPETRRLSSAQQWRWVGIDELLALAVPFKRETYERVIAAFRDLATPE